MNLEERWKKVSPAEQISDQTLIRIAVISANPNKTEAVEDFGQLSNELTILEKKYEDMINAIRYSKRRVSKARTRYLINSNPIPIKNE